MVDRISRSLSARVSGLAWWHRVLLAYGATRALTFLLFLLAAATQGENYWTKAQPGYFDFLNIWDVEWYGKIFQHGYPALLPMGADGVVQQNEWAFLPGFPAAVKAFAFTGLEFKFLAPILATLFGALFALVAFRVFAAKLNDHQAFWAVVLFNLSPASPILQTGYAESLGLLLIAGALYFWINDRFLLTILALSALAFTRPGLAAFALAFAAVWVFRVIQAWMRRRDFGPRESFRLIGLTLIALALNFAWPAVAGAVTGRPDAYVATELAWRSSYPFDGGGLVPLLPWFSSAQYFIGGFAGQAVVILAIFGAIAIFFSPRVRALGFELNAFVGSYFVYLLLFFFPQSSIVRILMPSFVIFGAAASAFVRWPSWGRKVALATLVLLQLGWLLTCWRYQAPDFSPP
jgi:hypothetical protein